MNIFTDTKNPRAILDNIRKNYLRRSQAPLFNSFINNYLNCDISGIIAKETINEALDSYDAIIVGSDQVWNTEITFDDETYFLPFNLCGKRVAYAASFGRNQLNEAELKFAGDNLPAFDVVSVREASAVDELAEIGIAAKLVVDPVFLPGKGSWLKLRRAPESIVKYKEGYTLVYALSRSDALFKAAAKESLRLGLPLLCVHPFCTEFPGASGTMLPDVGPQEFLYLLSNARVVFSNSFHCMAFSIIFGKRSMYTPNGNLGGRVDSLLNLARAERRVIGDDLIEMDFTKYKTSASLQAIIDESRQLLRNELSS